MTFRFLSMRGFRILFGTVGIAFLAVTLWGAYNTRGIALPTWPSMLAALLASALALLAGTRGWVALFDGSGDRTRLASAFLVSQLGKYIPGGVWQVVGPVGLAVGPQVSVGRAATIVPTQILVHLASGGFVGALVAPFGFGAPARIRVLALLGLLLLPLLYRPWLAAAAARVRRWVPRAAGREPLPADAAGYVPSQRAVLTCFAWDSLALVLSGIAFMLLLRGTATADSGLHAVFAFSLAWVAGFLAVPVPAGIGVREVVLFATLRTDTALVIAASLALRVVTMIAEAGLALATWRRA